MDCAVDLNWRFTDGFPATAGGLQVQITEGLSAAAAEKAAAVAGGGGGAALSDVAAAVVECIQALPWDRSRIVTLGGASEAGEVWPPPCDDDSAKVWLVGSSRVEAAVQAAMR